MRDLDVIESELRLLAAVRRTAAEVGAPAPRVEPVDEPLERVSFQIEPCAHEQ
jgi:hypothetical protein